MAFIAIGFGVLLTLLGAGVYEYTNQQGTPQFTALIPAIFGIPLIALGVIARNENARKHAMHAAALLGLLGFLVPLGRVIYVMTQPGFHFGLAAGASIAMSALCAIFLGLCVKSFIDVRIARKKTEAESQPGA
jgi:hypothetical protein